MKHVRDLNDEGELEAALATPAIIVLKHGARCGISASARQELERFMEEEPGIVAFAIEVGEHRDLSDAIARRLGVAHQSPQAFVVREGRAVWHASHFDITAAALGEALAD